MLTQSVFMSAHIRPSTVVYLCNLDIASWVCACNLTPSIFTHHMWCGDNLMLAVHCASPTCDLHPSHVVWDNLMLAVHCASPTCDLHPSHVVWDNLMLAVHVFTQPVIFTHHMWYGIIFLLAGCTCSSRS